MNNNQLIFNANTVIDQLQMAPEEIKREDIVRFVRKTTFDVSTSCILEATAR